MSAGPPAPLVPSPAPAPPLPGPPASPREPAADGPGSLVDTLVGLWMEPTETFRAIARRPAFLVPLVGSVLLNLIFTFVWLHKADPVELSRNQMQEAGVFDRIPPERQEEVVQRQARMLPIVAWLGPVVFGPLVFVALAGMLLFVFRFFYESETTFVQSLAVVWWTFFAVGLVTTPVTLLIMSLRGEWSVDPRMVVQANLASFVNKHAVPKAVYALLDSFDLFSAWILFLLSAGYAAAGKRSVGSAAFGVLALWVVYVLLKMGLALVF